MSQYILRNIKGSEIPAQWLETVPANPDQIFTVVIQLQESLIQDIEMPAEERISSRFVKTVERSSDEYRLGKGTVCRTSEDLDACFEEIENE